MWCAWLIRLVWCVHMCVWLCVCVCGSRCVYVCSLYTTNKCCRKHGQVRSRQAFNMFAMGFRCCVMCICVVAVICFETSFCGGHCIWQLGLQAIRMAHSRVHIACKSTQIEKKEKKSSRRQKTTDANARWIPGVHTAYGIPSQSRYHSTSTHLSTEHIFRSSNYYWILCHSSQKLGHIWTAAAPVAKWKVLSAI